MSRRFVAPLALVAGLLLATEGSAYWVLPDRHITTLTHEQRDQLLRTLQHVYPPELALAAVDSAIAVQRRGAPRTVRLVVIEETPAELPPVVVVVVVGNTVQDADVRTWGGDGEFTGGPDAIFHFGANAACVFEGESSERRRLMLYFRVTFATATE